MRGSRHAAPSPISPAAASTAMASPYARSGVAVSPATSTVPAIAVPRVEPRFEMLRDSPEISPCSSSPKLDCTTLTDGVSIRPSPRPISSRPGANAHTDGEPTTMSSSSPMPPMVSAKPATMSVRCDRRCASRSAASDDASRPAVAAVKITPVSIAS
ncbi:hypothetical protein HD601_001288 [Jiangella mangrovi]|uniref:Uncharacterized protein n=1 Tax=Jiangella mangrovi TaxID=1524084 RepID=A0A7W9GN38_9ACTN|nr:hypothetical protein [Jiangella mangrovi]MBB5786713.1 hypothetical protein [Jiangella mangrovi]